MKITSLCSIVVLVTLSNLCFTLKAQPTIHYEVYDNLFLWGCADHQDQKCIFINILGISGGSGNYTVTGNSTVKVSKTSVTENEGFEIFVPLNTNVNNINFTISDFQGGSSASIDNGVKGFLEYAANTAQLEECLAPDKCSLPDIELVEGDRIYADLYQTLGEISYNGTLPDRNTTFIAGESITLLPGFSSVTYSNFEAKIDISCN